MSSNRLPPIFILSGPSGVGKTTIVDRLLERSQLPLRKAVTATSRSPRPGEVDGVHYHFWTADRFRQAIVDGEMLEHAVVHGRDYYGTPRSEVDPYRAAGFAVVLVIDVQGAEQVRHGSESGHVVSIFLDVDDHDTLRQRLEARGESPENIERRLQTAAREMARAGEFDCRILNHDMAVAVEELENVIRYHYPQPEN